MKFLKATLILIFGPVLGIVIGSIVGSLALPEDPNFAAKGGHAAPGDGLEILHYLFISLFVSVVASAAAALWVLFRKPKTKDHTETP